MTLSQAFDVSLRPMLTMRAALIVLNFNGTSDTIECLQSIYRDKPAAADVIVVDNASGGCTVSDLHRAFPDTEILELSENRGWAGGNNAGIRLALARGYELICLMNNDLSVIGGALSRLLDAASCLEPCLLHPAIYYYDEPAKAQLDPSLTGEPISGHEAIYEMSFAYGACLLVHAEVFRRVGLLDERFFLQLEETDFHLRAAKAGIRSLCQSEARVLHKESASIGKISPLKTYYMVRNRLLLAEKHSAGIAGRLTALRSLIWTLHRLSGGELSPLGFAWWLRSGNPHAIASRRGVRDYIMRRFGRISDASQRTLSQHRRSWSA